MVLGATLLFASASLVFADFSTRISALWMNCFKALVAIAALTLTLPFAGGLHFPGWTPLLTLLASGAIGLCCAVLFLLRSFTLLGVGRTLILFGFQPLFMGVAAFYLLGQPFPPERLIAVLFLVACLFTFSLERFRNERRWEVIGLLTALLGVALDTCGVLLSRIAFETQPTLAPLEGHFFRCLGALLAFFVVSRFRPIRLVSLYRAQAPRAKGALIAASLAGTYLSLLLYLTAVKIGHLASIAGVVITGPLFATALESLIQRRRPSGYVLVAFGFFAIGFYILVLASQGA